MKQSGIYKITNKTNGKFYIGSSLDIHRRWRQHRRDLTKNIHINPKLQHAWNKYGSENFSFEILELTEDVLNREEHYLKTLKPDYNVCSSVFDLTANKNPNWRGGTTFCECGSRISTESACCGKCRKRDGKHNPFFGHSHSQETILKLKKANQGKLPPNLRKVKIDGNIYLSVSEAARQLGVCPATVIFRIKSQYWDYEYILTR
jgi:group I intron endonuclease